MKRLDKEKIIKLFNTDLGFRRIYNVQTLARYFYRENSDLYDEDTLKFYADLGEFLHENGISEDVILADCFDISVVYKAEIKKLKYGFDWDFSTTYKDLTPELASKVDFEDVLTGDYGVDFWWEKVEDANNGEINEFVEHLDYYIRTLGGQYE